MGRIVFAWEFGGGLGHIQYDLPLAIELQKRGHEVFCIMKNVIDAERIMGRHGIKVLQAPVWQVKIKKKLENTFNYAEALFNQGYLVEGGLSSMAKAWRCLFDFVKPDMLIADHAPTALIAARGTRIKTILYGTGFFAPPMQKPMPSIIPWKSLPAGLIEYSEKKAVETINVVLDEIGSPLLNSLSDLFVVDENILATFQELDHYQNRDAAKYWGPVISLPEGETPQWPGQQQSQKIFCYLKPHDPNFDEILSALSKIDAACIIFAPKLPHESKKKFQSSSFVFFDKPLDMNQVCKECDLVICHAGHGTVAIVLLHGKPLLLVPEHGQLEQVLIAHNLAGQKLGVSIYESRKADEYKMNIERVLNEPKITEQARMFAEKYRNFNPEKQVSSIADRCEKIMK
jgi:UDP:flavonoid glycosyltransferase YjiC (YdhE family)